MEGLLHFWEDDSTFMEWFCIGTVDVATNSCSSPGISSMCASENTVTPYVSGLSQKELMSARYKNQHLQV